jgi:hypothetical protein
MLVACRLAGLSNTQVGRLRADLDVEIVALRLSGVCEPEICVQLGCTMGRVRAALDASAARMLAPGWRARARADSLETLAMLDQALSRRAAATRR